MARKVGAINTETVVLIGGGLLLAYMLTKKTTTTVAPPTYVTVPTGGGSGVSTGQLVTIGNSLINALDDIFS